MDRSAAMAATALSAAAALALTAAGSPILIDRTNRQSRKREYYH